MKRYRKQAMAGAAACLVAAMAQAQVSDETVKIAVLSDMSSLYADGAG